ncbi:IS110 family transposase [Nonomuraea sp. NPDC050451]|uniref:IS110 family transposase n=1 Tax=Nonomuraea sp. NPDC050451 TaxID=3364364 RepID=UPI00379B30E6
MAMLSESVDAVIGVDTHRDSHSARLVNPVGGELAAITITADADGYAHLIRWAAQHAPGPNVVWAIEGTRSHGAGLARALRITGQQVIESDRPKRVSRRGSGMNDALGARRAAREALGCEQSAIPRTDGPREAARMLLVTRESAISARTSAVNQLKALILTAPEPLWRRLRSLKRQALIDACLRLRPAAVADAEERTRRTVMQRLARRIRNLTDEVHAAETELAELVDEHVSHLLQMRGVGVITAAQCWVSWSGPGRFRNEAAFAALAGVSPIEASSGRHTRHRLNPFGDRALNRALHHIALTLERCDPETRNYLARRTSDGKTRREAIRCLKRYLARKIYRALEHPPSTAQAA